MNGLKYIFRGQMIHDAEMHNSSAFIKSKFEKLSNGLGYKIALREDLVNFFANQFLYTHKDIKKSFLYFTLNTENYPNHHFKFKNILTNG